MSQRTLGLIMNGVSGRMGVNQHLIRSVAAIRAQGGVLMSDGSRVMLDPVLVSRTGEKVKALAEQHGGLRWTTDLDAEIASPRNHIFFDTATRSRFQPSIGKRCSPSHEVVRSPSCSIRSRPSARGAFPASMRWDSPMATSNEPVGIRNSAR